ncbi:adenylate cyclase type 10-like isoform X1 [Anopheles stephensi]|uniref:adenylate cyclase type 10-like isoform X1 n=1 Tax=Anopheles stephensi TaxID=30069 RepID=UPI001658765D|nr:adenylate cyclase type 10-like isoform X1 [Anopheles stephensi]
MLELSTKLAFLTNRLTIDYILFFSVPSSKADFGSARLKKAVDKELFVSRCRNRLKGKKNLKKYLPERFSFLYQFLWNQMPSNLYENIMGKLNKSHQEFTTKVISSMVPDEVLYSPDDYKTSKFMTAMMFVDVSGFTDLSELYHNPENGGASKLSQVLNTYLGGIVNEILGHGGDILKFSGDAILVLFKANSSVSLPDAIHRAIDTAIIIQLSYGRYKTDVGVTLRNKIAISAGEVHFSLVGNESFSHYVVAGQPVWKVKLAERMALAGDIIVTYYAWSYIHDNEYVWESCADKMHLKIKGFTSYWRSTKRLNFADAAYRDDEEDEDLFVQDDAIKIDSEMIAIRPRLKYVTPHVVSSSLQKFLIKPVLNAVENNEPLELLTEMRQIVTVFLNIVLKPRDVTALIKEINSIFTTVCKIVEGYEGIVNKLSLFDKDVMFLIIFGLRGLKHEMDSQLALHCACEIQDTYAKNPSIISASIGITTGIAYCGIVGHTVRREYSAIGVHVNKAARLMMAYPHKVTCDKSTFMMSKLDPAHFTLQDAIQLKGLHNVGPIYEFREFIAERELLKPMVYNYPLVDRDQFIEIFQEMIDDGMVIAQQCTRSDFPNDQWIQNCLLIRGEAQMGKTRLVNEFFYIALRNKHISSLCFSLSLKDSKKPYSAASLCISRPLGFTETITTVTRQNRMKLYLREHKMEQHLSLLNEVLGTNFIVTEATASLNQTEKDSARKELFRFLCQKTFQNLWVLIIDDAEFIDDESFDLFDAIWEMPQIITVLTVGYQKRLSPARIRVLDSPNVCQVKLPPIETLLHKAVACQFLNVNAIPLDLERLLHTISNGNPGWINTFLLCLRQSGILRVKRMGYCEAQTEGYVFCDSSFLQRDSIKSSSTIRPSLSDWRLFESSFDVGDPLLYPGDQTPSLFNKIVDVAYLTDAVDTKDYYTSRNLEAFHLMLYDSLSAFEQLVCKCAAFLGQKFLRASLMYTMATESEWDVAIAMKKLFDLQILSCAIGDFSEGFRLAQRNVNSSWLGRGECACIALEIDRACKDLPKYAVCGYSKFNSSEFHSTVYNLVTVEQKKQYHSNALEFIESETKKCNSCGAVPFKNLMSCEETYEVQVGCQRSEELDGNEMLLQYSTSRFSLYSSQQSFIFGCFKRRRSSSRRAPVLSYKAYSFVSCNCNMILYGMFSEIVLHSKGAGMLEKCVEASIEWARICIKLSNIPKAISILEDAAKMMTQIDKAENIALVTYLKGRLYTLEAKGRYGLEQFERSLELYYRASRTLGMNFPRHRSLVRLKSRFYLGKVKKYLDPNGQEKTPSTKSLFYSLIVSQIASCFNGMHKLFVKLRDWDRATLAAIWSLKHALRYRKSSTVLVKSFANFFHTAYHVGFSESTAWMQERSLEIVAENVRRIDADYLDAIVRYYTALFLCQTVRSKKVLSIELGKVVLQINDRLQYQSCEWDIIPILCEVLLSNRRIAETVQTLWTLQKLIIHQQYRTGHIWYYAICLDVLLDTSCCIESYRRCENFYFKNRESFLAQRNSFASARLFANLWLWCVRYGAWVAADNWLVLLRENFVLSMHDSTININTAIRIVEGMVLTLIYHIEARNTAQIRRVRAGIETLLASIEQALSINRNHVARFELMRIYYRQVVDPAGGGNVRRQLAAAAKRAQSRNDHLCHDHIQHTAKFWNRELPPALETFWLDHAAGSDRMDGTSRSQSFAAGSLFDISSEQLYDFTSCILHHEQIYPYSLPLSRAR